MAHVKNNSGKMEWYTPADIVDAARAVMGGIDLDPASSARANTIINATYFYDEEHNGLDLPWHGRIWLNPPYARGLIDQFADRLVDCWANERIAQAVCLTNNATDTKWGQALLAASTAVCFLSGRVCFIDGDTMQPVHKPLQGQMITYFGCQLEKFGDVFDSLGIVRY